MRKTQILTLLAILSEARCDLNMTWYYQMPPMYSMDNYDRCFIETSTKPVYCLVRADSIPNQSSELWNQIDEFSSSLGHFRHNEITFGLCVPTCKNLIDKTSNSNIFYNGILIGQPLVHFQTTKVFKSHEHFRKKYNKLLNICINIHSSNIYNLKMKSNILYCDNNTVGIEESEHSIDYWNLAFYSIAGCIVFMTALASISRLDSHVISAFSLSKNWQRLVKEDTTDLKFLSAIRFFIQIGVIYAHSVWGVVLSPVSNPEFFETKSYWSLFNIGGPTILSSFYVLSIFLLTLNFLNLMRSEAPIKPARLSLSIIGFRLTRISVPYAFMVMFQGLDIWPNVISPMFKFHIDREMWGCRESWWTNLLYVNNIFKMSENCMMQGWYLANDTQIYIGCLLLLIFFNKYPRLRMIVLSIGLILSVIIRTSVIYSYGCDANLLTASPQISKNHYHEDNCYTELYSKPHTNYGSGLIGLIAGYIYDNLKQKNYNLRNSKVFLATWISSIFGMIFLMLLFYWSIDTPKPSFLIAVFGGFILHLWALFWCIFGVGLGFKVGGCFLSFLNHHLFTVFGRLSFAAYMVHMFFMRMAFAFVKETLYVNTFHMMYIYIGIQTLSYFAALILALFIEFPISALLKSVIKKDYKPAKKLD